VFSTLLLGKVYIGYQRDNFRKVALKIMPKTDYVQLTAIEEIKILSELSHPNIIKVEGGTDYNNYFVIVMELASGGELFDYVKFQSLYFSIALFLDSLMLLWVV
jgi:serine/threonine protein kinase